MEDEDFTPWDIDAGSSAIEIRFLAETEHGADLIERVLFRVGSKIPDRGGYYGLAEEPASSKPLLFLDAEWAETLLGLFDDIPYGSRSQNRASGRGS